jgi:hypothetical protein
VSAGPPTAARTAAGWRPLGRGDGVNLLVRALVVGVPSLAVVSTWAAAGGGRPFVLVAAAALGVLCARRPDRHVGLVVVALVGVNWLATVDDHTTPWSVAVACLLAVFHAAAAAFGVAPPAATWTRAMGRRWLRRTSVLAAASGGTWLVVAALDGRAGRGRGIVLFAALALITSAALWAHGRPVDEPGI